MRPGSLGGKDRAGAPAVPPCKAIKRKGQHMPYADWLKAFPMRQTKRSSGTPGRCMKFSPTVLVQAKGNGFFQAPGAGIKPHPVADERDAIAVFLDLWHRAQAEAPRVQDNGEHGGA